MRVVLLFLFYSLFSQSIYADHLILSTSHAPIGVMWPLTKKYNHVVYRYVNSIMNEILSGSTKCTLTKFYQIIRITRKNEHGNAYVWNV